MSGKRTTKFYLVKEKVVAELQKLAENADHVYLATDLDREGEALSHGTFVRSSVAMKHDTSEWFLTKLLKMLFSKLSKLQVS